MYIELIESSKNRYKLITKNSHKHPALEHIAELLKESNKHSNIKIGIYSITGGKFSLFKRIYSYISKRVDRMNKPQFYAFMNGKRQLRAKKSTLAGWKAIDPNKVNKNIEIVLDLD